MNKHKINWYSAAAAVFFVNPILADAQMVHVNINPDKLVGPYSDYSLDLNDDGISEIEFNGSNYYDASSWGGELHGFTSSWVYIYPNGTFATFAGQISHLELGDTVDADLIFNEIDPLFFYAHRDIGPGGGFVSIYEGTEWVNNEGYFGIKFQIDSETHYGWVKLKLIQNDPDYLPKLYVREFAYNETPDAPAPISIYYADASTALVLSDIGESNTPADLQLTFNKAENEMTVSKYRVALFTGIPFPTIGEMEALTPDRYTEIEPTGEDISISFDADILDVAGNPVVSGTWYRAIVLSVADGVYAIDNELSAPSNSTFLSLEAAPAGYAVELQTDSISTDISGFMGTFTMNDTSVSAVRLFITANEMTIDELLALDEPYYMETIPTIGENTVPFTVDKLIYEAGDPELFDSYYLYVVSLPDSITNSFPAVGVGSGYFMYKQFPVAPEITIIGYTGNSSDILLEFPHLPNETSLEVYRVFVCKPGTEVNAEFVGDLHAVHYESVYPMGMDLYMDLTDCNLDTDGDPIIQGQPYVAYVAMRCVCDDYFYCISLPSAEFTLLEPVNIESSSNSANWVFSGNELQTTQPVQQPTQLQIFSASGQLVFDSSLPAGCTTIQLPQLPAGVFLAYFSNSQGQQVLKFGVE